MPQDPTLRPTPTLKFLAGKHPLPVEPDLGHTPALHAFGRTDVGRTRQDNEDHFLVAEIDRVVKVDCSSFDVEQGATWPVHRQARLLMVADGIGGHTHGAIASAVAVDAMLEAVTAMPQRSADDRALIEGLESAVAHAQRRVASVAERKALRLNPGTTLTLAYVDWPTMLVAHVGDSRCYLVRDGALRQLTDDHTLAAAVEDMGAPSDGEMGKHVLLNAIGGGTDDLRVDLHRQRLERGDRVLLCTDGLHDLVSDHQILSIVDGSPDFMQATDGLIGAALAAGGTDNVTAVLMQVAP